MNNCNLRGQRRIVTEQEWKQLEDLVRKAQAGDKESLSAACEIIYAKLKRDVSALLWRKGAVRQDLFDEAWQDAMLMFVKSYGGINEVRSLRNWLARTVLRFVWKKQSPRSQRQEKAAQAFECVLAPPQQIGTKSITIDGQQREIKVYAPCDSPAAPSRQQSLLTPLTDLIIETQAGTSFPDYEQDIDTRRVWEELHNALVTLPKRWARAVELVYFEEKSRSEAAHILGCSRKRIYKILKMAKRRLRELLAGSPECRTNRTVSLVQAERPVGHCETRVMERYRDEIRHGIGPFEQSDKMAGDAWWPLVLESLRRHADASYFAGDDGN
jgi:RNA polymerase sigma factor (sigma-70 family)